MTRGRAAASRALWALCAGAALLACAGPAPVLRSEPRVLREAHPELEPVAGSHRVAPGENLYRIALRYGLTTEALSRANGITDPRSLSVGQLLRIPEGGASAALPVERLERAPRAEAPVASAAGPSSSSSLPERRVAAASVAPAPARTGDRRTPPPSPRLARASSRAPRSLSPHRGTLSWPLRGVLYGRYGRKGREPHDGIDLAAPEGTPVKTARAGRVLFAGEQRGYGLIVIVEHTPSLITLYAHNRDLRVRTGQQVRDGQVIATVGQSGKTSGPHLHFEVRHDGSPANPMDYLGALPRS